MSAHTPVTKQLPSFAVFAAALVVTYLITPGDVRRSDLVQVGALGVVVASIVSIAYTRVPAWRRYEMIVPAITLMAFGLFRAGTGGSGSLYTSLTILPVVWLASGRGRRFVLYAILGTSVVMFMPYFFEWQLPASAQEWLRGFVLPSTFGLAAGVVNELTRQARIQMDAIERMAEERKNMLDAALKTAKRMRVNKDRLAAADEFTRQVLDAVTEQSIIGTDLTGHIDVWNPGAMAMLGVGPVESKGSWHVTHFHVAEELMERAKELQYPPGATVLNPGFSALVESARRGRAEVRDWTYVREDGSELAVRVAVTPRMNRNNEVVGYLFVGTDVTHQLEVARLKDDFVGLISHELRTPLSSIIGYLELLKDDEKEPLSEEQLVYLSVAERNAHRLLRLVGDLLLTAQVSSGAFPLALAETDLHSVAAASVESAGPSARAAGVTITALVPDRCVFVRADGVRLAQACDNLISNAIKFTPRGGSVTVALASVDGHAVLTVRDTGMGIPADDMDKLASRFFRASTATRNAVPGVGLGLTITKAIITAHGGTLDARSEVGVGTVFIMSIPLKAETAAPDLTPA